MGNPSHSYGASLAILDHIVLVCHSTQSNAPRHNPSQRGRYSVVGLVLGREKQ